MAARNINFFVEDIPFKLKNKANLRDWLFRTITSEGKSLGELNFIFCNDQYLLQINLQYLNHDTYTDIITFDNSTPDSKRIIGDIFISTERIEENARKFQVPFVDELHRVIIHGTLHLLGYRDKSKEQKAEMRSKEDLYLKDRNF